MSTVPIAVYAVVRPVHPRDSAARGVVLRRPHDCDPRADGADGDDDANWVVYWPGSGEEMESGLNIEVVALPVHVVRSEPARPPETPNLLDTPRAVPGDLVSHVAGGIRRPQMRVRIERRDANGRVDVSGTAIYVGSFRVRQADNSFAPMPLVADPSGGFGCMCVDRADPVLDDDLTRDACARWLATHHGLTLGATAPIWYQVRYDGIPAWALVGADGRSIWFSASPCPSHVPASRWVRVATDEAAAAPALALACLVAGGQS